MEFFDTNVLVYTVDPAEPQRSARACALIRDAVDARSMAISTQVMLEFYATAVLKKRLIKPEGAVGLLREWARDETISTSPEMLWKAFDLQQKFGFSIFDATIVQSALELHCDVLYSEDLQHGQRIGPLRIVNPFRSDSVHEPRPAYKATPRRKRKAA
jgi:predicted nucleic acid-binding protein